MLLVTADKLTFSEKFKQLSSVTLAMSSFAGKWQRLVEFLAKQSYIILNFQKNIKLQIKHFYSHYHEEFSITFYYIIIRVVYVYEHICSWVHMHPCSCGHLRLTKGLSLSSFPYQFFESSSLTEFGAQSFVQMVWSLSLGNSNRSVSTDEDPNSDPHGRHALMVNLLPSELPPLFLLRNFH